MAIGPVVTRGYSIGSIQFVVLRGYFSGTAPSPPPPPVGGETILTKGKSGPTGTAFTRKRFDEFMAAWRAQEALEARATEEIGKRRIALERAAEAAAVAIEAAQASEVAEAADLERLIGAMQAADRAVKVKDILRQAKLATLAADAFIQEMEEEEEAIMLLLMH